MRTAFLSRITGSKLRSLYIAALALVSFGPIAVNAQSLPAPRTFYVSPTAIRSDIQDGSSWKRAWPDVSRIDWRRVNPGDIIKIDGGSSSITYNSPLIISKNGTSQKPIYIVTATETGRNGQVCFKAAGALPTGIYIGAQNIRLRGSRWNAIQVTNYSHGITISPGAKNVRLSNIEIVGNGNVPFGPFAESGGAGILLNNNIENITLNQLVIHDNSAGRRGNLAENTNVRALDHNLSGVHFNRCLIYNTIPSYGHPSDGIRLHTQGGSAGSSVDFRNCVIGPGLRSGIAVEKLGATRITVNGALFLAPATANIDVRNYDVVAYKPSSQVSLSHVTSFLNPKQIGTTCLGPFVGSVPQVTHSIFYGGKVQVSGATRILGIENYQYKTTGNTMVISPFQIDPRFVSNLRTIPSTSDGIMLLNFALRPGSPATGSGANITSVRQLLSINMP